MNLQTKQLVFFVKSNFSGTSLGFGLISKPQRWLPQPHSHILKFGIQQDKLFLYMIQNNTIHSYIFNKITNLKIIFNNFDVYINFLVNILTISTPDTSLFNRYYRYSETCLNPTLNKSESCINQTLNKFLI